MRWDNLKVDADEARRLPGYRDGAVVRRFDAPEAMNVRFYEVRARSAINEVPKASRMPFRYTINPYRGCTHACTYCVSGDTAILTADGRTNPIADLRVGEAIYGTVREGDYRRYTITRVLAHWAAEKDGYRITLEDGTELLASGDHRFLTGRGWKHVVGAEQGHWRPHLTLNDKLIGSGHFARQPVDSSDYRRGYLCGLVRGDGHVASHSYERAGRAHGDVHRFRLALTDLEALRQAREYLVQLDAPTGEFLFQAAGAVGSSRPVMAIRTQAEESVARVRSVIEWPRVASNDWCKGFLAGIFDAQGSHGGCVRISNTDRAIIDWTTWCLRRFGFDVVIEPTGRDNGLATVRIRGGLREVLRFLHTVDPAITRKRSIEGTALKSNAPLKVVSIEPLGRRLPMFDITTGTGDFIANGVVSHNCFARPTHTYLDFNAREDFEREIVVKVNLPEVLRAELARPSWKREHVALGTNTDPYQWVEGRYRLMPEVWKALRDSGTPCSVLTKSPLLLRDIDLMRELADQVGFTANLSIPTLEEKAWRATEPHTPHPRKRLEAVAELARAGIPTGVLIAPLMPGINDAPGQVEEILRLALEAGAGHVGGVALHLRGEVREIFFDWLRAHRPDLIARYEALYRRGAYMPRAEQESLTARARARRSGPPRGALRGTELPSVAGSDEPRTPQATLF